MLKDVQVDLYFTGEMSHVRSYVRLRGVFLMLCPFPVARGPGRRSQRNARYPMYAFRDLFFLLFELVTNRVVQQVGTTIQSAVTCRSLRKSCKPTCHLRRAVRLKFSSANVISIHWRLYSISCSTLFTASSRTGDHFSSSMPWLLRT